MVINNIPIIAATIINANRKSSTGINVDIVDTTIRVPNYKCKYLKVIPSKRWLHRKIAAIIKTYKDKRKPVLKIDLTKEELQ